MCSFRQLVPDTLLGEGTNVYCAIMAASFEVFFTPTHLTLMNVRSCYFYTIIGSWAGLLFDSNNFVYLVCVRSVPYIPYPNYVLLHVVPRPPMYVGDSWVMVYINTHQVEWR